MPSDYIEKNSLIPMIPDTDVVHMTETDRYSKTPKKAKDAYEDHIAKRELEEAMRDPWEID